jgi:alpha-L-fucosidase
MKMKTTLTIIACLILLTGFAKNAGSDYTKKIDDKVRAEQIADMKFGMFICWSFSTFSGKEWTPTEGKDASYFKATGCNTDQWCKVAKDAGMGYILFLTKHHDGFCLWDTKTTEKKVTNSPLKIDVLAKLRKSCDKYGIKLALYFSEGDWNFPGASFSKSGGSNPEIKKAQLKELLTNYGPIEYIWFDHAQGDGGLSHEETDKWVSKFQPNCLAGYNNGTPAGQIRLGERGYASALDDISGAGYNKHTGGYKGYIAAEFTYPILPDHKGGADWFYSLPKHDQLCFPAEKIYQDYLGAVKFRNIFSLDIGPDYKGEIRAIDIKTLKQVGRYIKGKDKFPEDWNSKANEKAEKK